MGQNCQVCAHPKRGVIEASIYEGLSNEDAAHRFGLGDGGPTSGEIIREHRAAGHMRPPEHYRGRPWLAIEEEG